MAKRNFLVKLGPLSSSAAASTTTIPANGTVFDLDKYDSITLAVKIVGCTGGTLDVYLQRKLETDEWRDFAHFPQVAAGTTKHYQGSASLNATITEIGTGTDSAASPALAANTIVAGHPGTCLRVVCVTGAGVSVAGTVTVYVLGTNVH